MTLLHPLRERRLRALLALLLLLALWPRALQAQTPTPASTAAPLATIASQSAADADLDSLLKILHEETAVATKTRMNGDYVPGIVTVLHGEEMAALGARTVWDALAFVPGIEAVRDISGLPSVIVRGVQFPFNSGNVKVLLDSMPAARDNAGINSIILDIPIALVDRIEVIRGPGSVVYGDFAYMGLIHIVTKKSGLGAWARGEEGSTLSGGGWGGGRTARGLEYSFAGSLLTGNAADVRRPSDADDTRAFGSGSLRYRGFSLSGDATTRTVKTREAPGEQTHTVIEARYAREISATTRIEARANRRGNRFRNVSSDLDGDVREAGLGLQWTGASRQSWLFDASFTQSRIDRAVFPDPPAPTPAPPPASGPGGAPPPPPPLGFTVRDQSLAFFSVMAQDTIEASARVALTLGGRIDRYADIDTRLTPRASVVFRASERNILKVQYAEGFCAPTFFELYARGFRDTRLDYEVNRTVEANFVHRRPGAVLRVTGYNARLADLIYIVGSNPQRQSVFENARAARATGLEVEWEKEMGRRLKAVVNLSWSKTRDSRNGQNLYQENATVADFMSNVALIAAPRPKTRVTVKWHYVGPRGVASLKAYSELEATLTRKAFLGPGLSLRAGARVSPGAGVIYPHVMPNALAALSYRFPRAFAELTWSR